MSSSAYPSNTTPVEIPLDSASVATAASIADEVLALFDACAPGVRRYIRSSGVPADVVDDIVQETFLALFRHLRRGGNRENLRGWLMQVGYRQALKHRRGEGRRHRWQRPWNVDPEVLPDPAAGPAEAYVAGSDQQRLWAVLQALPEKERQCVFLRAEGLRYREIAQALGVSLGAVAKYLTRAMERLSASIET